MTKDEITEMESGEELDEMARIPKRFDIGEKIDELPEKYAKNKYIQGIIEYIREKGPSTIEDIARDKFGVNRQLINPLFTILPALGILTDLGLEREPDYLKPKEPKAPKEPKIKDDETSDEPVDKSNPLADFNFNRNTAKKSSSPAVEPENDITDEPSFDSDIESEANLESQIDAISNEMRALAKEFKTNKSDDVKQKLKDLTKQKKDLEKQLEPPTDELDEIEDESDLMMEGYTRFQKLAGIRVL